MLKEYPYKSQLLVLCLSTCLSIAIYSLRVQHSDQLFFLFLIWNLFLAWIPYIISSSLIVFQVKRKSTLVLAFCLWLLFLPNSPYIITDFFHLRPRSAAPFWLDLVLLVSFAWTGLFLGLSSLQHMHKHLFQTFGKSLSWLGVIFILFLTSFGVYLGRFERWNSWDLMTQPEALIRDIFTLIFYPSKHSLGFTLAFGAFLVICYLAFSQKDENNTQHIYSPDLYSIP